MQIRIVILKKIVLFFSNHMMLFVEWRLINVKDWDVCRVMKKMSVCTCGAIFLKYLNSNAWKSWRASWTWKQFYHWNVERNVNFSPGYQHCYMVLKKNYFVHLWCRFHLCACLGCICLFKMPGNRIFVELSDLGHLITCNTYHTFENCEVPV